MSQQAIPILSLSMKATGTIVANRFVTHAGLQTGAGARALGVARFAGVTGDMITVDALGTAVVEAGAAIALGAQVEADSSGRAITKSAGVVLAAALQAASAAGDLIEVLQIPN